MGINGLLKSLESIKTQKHISDYKGKRIAIDGYCWLHKSIYSMKNEIINNPDSDKYLNYLVKRLEMLLKYKIIPVFIFDGDKLPAKKNIEEEREKKRSDTRKLGKDYLNKGDVEKAKSKFVESYDVNPKMAFNFIKILKAKNIEFFVAPYEADAQLAYLEKIKYVDMVMTEDSDLLAYGCQTVLFKFENEGFLDEINLKNLQECRGYNFKGFSHDSFLIFCILCGCDYFKLDRCGAKKAYQIARERRDYCEIISYLKISNLNITENVEKDFEKAFLTFKFQVVFCPLEKKYRYFNDLDETKYQAIYNFPDLSFLGKILDEETARNIAYGVIDPISLERFEETKNSKVKKLFEGKNKTSNSSNNLSSAHNNNKNTLNKYFKKSNSDLSDVVTKNPKTHYLENPIVFEDENSKYKRSNRDYDSSKDLNYFSNKDNDDDDEEQEEEEENNINSIRINNSDDNFKNNFPSAYTSNSQIPGKTGLLNKLGANTLNDNRKNKLIKVNKNILNATQSQNNLPKNFSFLRNENAENPASILNQINNKNPLIFNKQIQAEVKESEKFKEKSSEEFLIDLTSKSYDNEKNTFSALSASDCMNGEFSSKIKSKENTSSNIDLDILQNYYFDLTEDLEVPQLNNPINKKVQNQPIKNNNISHIAIEDGAFLNNSNSNYNYTIGNNVNKTLQNFTNNFSMNSNCNNQDNPKNNNFINNQNGIVNLNNFRATNDKLQTIMPLDDSNKIMNARQNKNELALDNYYFNDNENLKLNYKNGTNRIVFRTKRKSSQVHLINFEERNLPSKKIFDKFLNITIDSMMIQEQNLNELSFKNNENSINRGNQKQTFINPLIKTSNNSEIQNSIKINLSNNQRILGNNPIRNPINSNYIENKLESNHYRETYNKHNVISNNFESNQDKLFNSSFSNYSSNFQNNLSFNKDKVLYDNNNWCVDKDGKVNFSNSLASKMSTDTLKVLDTFDNYLNEYEDINKFNNNASENFTNRNSNKTINNLMDRSSQLISRNGGLMDNLEIDCSNADSRNIFILNQEKKNELINLNNNLFGLNQNPRTIIDLTNENNDLEKDLTNDNLVEILINCKDEQIQRELSINKVMKKKQKQNSFI